MKNPSIPLTGQSECLRLDLKTPKAHATLVSSAWHVAHAILWPLEKFKESEIQGIQNNLSGYITSDPHPETSFRIFIESIILYRKKFPQEQIVHPLVWFNQCYRGGFAQALQCYLEVAAIRKSASVFERSTFAFANCILKHIKNPDPAVFNSCRLALLRQKDEFLLRCFYYYIIHSTYIHN